MHKMTERPHYSLSRVALNVTFQVNESLSSLSTNQNLIL